MLETLEDQDKAIFYTAIEVVEDVSHTTLSGKDTGTYYEEDKNYDKKSNFTIFSPEIKNTLVSFFDIYIGHWQASEEIRLGFYTTAGIGKEKKKISIDGNDVDAPKRSILKSLSLAGSIDDVVVKMIKTVVVDEYKKQYDKKKLEGYLTTLEKMSTVDFRHFLEKIAWHFKSEDEKELKNTVINLIKQSKLHNVRIANKEETIFSLIMEMLDERQNAASLAQRVVNASDVKLIFKKAESEENDSVIDPTWEELRKIEEEITDKRNLPEKIKSVCPEYTERRMGYLARLACRSKTEQQSGNRSFLSLKYRIYEACSKYFFQNNQTVSTEAEIDEIIKGLNQLSIDNINELKKDYTYTVSNSQAIEGIIMDLFDNCFLSFDEDAHER
ncbi:MAG: hypothetical protein D3917_02980 [Candidatus Electrothrix sp. AX5]|nr:hypothetical protein [Candidatus Electrothrix sp. AX5]